MQTMLVVTFVLLVLLSSGIECNQDNSEGERLVVDAVGRNFILGMLYDRRSDQIIPGQ